MTMKMAGDLLAAREMVRIMMVVHADYGGVHNFRRRAGQGFLQSNLLKRGSNPQWISLSSPDAGWPLQKSGSCCSEAIRTLRKYIVL
jgi:hypothetical protein